MDRPHIDVNEDLRALLSEAFESKLCFYSSIPVLRFAIIRSSELRTLKKDYSMGILTETTVRNFVSHICETFTAGQRFPYRFALAALAVLLENVGSDYAEEYLLDLARTKSSEIEPAPRVAKHSLTVRNAVKQAHVLRNFEYQEDLDDILDECSFIYLNNSTKPKLLKRMDILKYAYA